MSRFNNNQKPNNLKVRGFNPKRENNNKNYQQVLYPRVIKVEEVFPASNGEGYFLGTDVHKNVKVKVKVDEALYKKYKDKEPTTDAAKVNIDGWIINDKFAKLLKGKYVTLTRTSKNKPEVFDGEEITVLTSGWMREAKDYSPEKYVEAVITASSFNQKSGAEQVLFQKWFDEPIRLDNQPDSIEKLVAMMEKINEVHRKSLEAEELIRVARENDQETKNIERPVKIGFALRTWDVSDKFFVKDADGNYLKDDNGNYLTPEGDVKDVPNTLLDRLQPLSYRTPEQDELGNLITNKEPINSEWLESFMGNYAGWAYKFTNLEDDEYNIEDNGAEFIAPKDIVVEVLFYEEYFASNTEENKLDNAGFDTPLDKAVRRKTKPSFDSEPNEFFYGKNFGEVAIMEISPDVSDAVTRTWITRNFVKRVNFPSKLKGLEYLIPCSLGGRTILPNELKTEEQLEAEKRGANYQAGQYASENVETFDDTFEI